MINRLMKIIAIKCCNYNTILQTLSAVTNKPVFSHYCSSM